MICIECNQDKDESEFYPSILRKRIRCTCKQCHTMITRADSDKRKLKDPVAYNNRGREKCRDWRKKNPIRSWAWHTRDRHKRNGFIVEFTTEELCEKVKDVCECPYCGKPINFNPYTDKDIGSRPTLDRINNETTITLDNCQVLCYTCNTMKSSMPHKEFINLLKQISDRCYNGD